MTDPNLNRSEINHGINSNDIRNSEIDASTNLEENFADLNIDNSVSQFTEKIKARNINKIKTGMKFENGISSDRHYQFIERLLILLGFGSSTVYFLNYDWLKQKKNLDWYIF